MKMVYACLVGNWVCLNDDPDCVIGSKRQSPSIWWEEGAEIYAPIHRNSGNTLYNLDYVHLIYKGTSYRINPMFIQIVGE